MQKSLLFVCFLTLCLPALAQTDKENNAKLFFEKTYLHTDRDVYAQGDTLWFKVYLVNAQDNKPINSSGTLYVELLAPDSAKIINREIIRLDNGLGNGDMELVDSLPSGRYLLRAYTNWMRNFGDNFILEKNITIVNMQTVSPALGSKTPSIINKAQNKSATAILTLNPSTASAIRFFPEGGFLVEGISSIVAVKAEDANGKGIPAKGSVISSAGDTVSHFNCDSLGMGLFALLPIKSQTYHAVVSKVGSFDLPKAIINGLTLQIKQTDTIIHAVINSTNVLASNSVTLVIKHGGKTQLNKQLSLQQLQTIFKIPTTMLPEGISTITVYNTQGQPECERLVYIHHLEDVRKLNISTDKKSYQPKERVNVTLRTQTNSHLSMAVVDAATVPVQTENILSYLNLQSEVKGRIENPNCYFDTINVNRFKQLDLLLMTQGWRDFVWRRLEDTTLKISYEPEQGINITGRVRKVGTNKPLPGIYITLHAPKAKEGKFFDVVTDSAGRFGLYGLQFYGYQYLYLSARDYGPKAKGKSNSGGWLQVDSLLRDTLPIKPAKWYYIKDSLFMTNPLSILNIPKNRQLKEVQIKATYKYANSIPPEYRNVSAAEQKDYGNVMQYLLYTIPEAHAGGGPCGIILMDNNISRYQGMIGIGGSYADHSPMDRSACPTDFLQLPLSSVLKLTINRAYDADFRLRLSVSLILRPGSLKVKDFFDDTMVDMVGYYKAREFYKPKFDNPDDIDPRTNTIHWEPNITTNEKGEASFSFYNTAQTGKVRVIAEGITPNGTPLVATSVYEVK